MFKKFLTGLVLIIAAIMVYASTKPDDFKVSRSTTINAPASDIYAEVSNLKAWDSWSPWAKLDPNAKTTFEGPETGVGAKMSWDGNMEVGKGSLTITESNQQRVAYDLVFEKPMAGTNISAFTLQEHGVQTQVTWSMEGKQSFPAKVMSIFMNCEKMVGEQFDKGLSNLKSVVENN